MELPQAQTQSRQRKKRLTQEQVRLLENSFTANKKLEPELKLQLANQLGVPPRQVAVWYQNKRARWKTQALELHHNTLQTHLENALAEKKRLEHEVKLLQEELKKSQDQIALLVMEKHRGDSPLDGSNCSRDHRFVSNHSSCDEGLSSEDGHEQVLEFDELYACLVSSGHGSSSSSLSWI